MKIEDYNFSQTSLDFLKEIEVDFEESILIEEKELEESEHGFAKYEDGIPIIELNQNEPFKQDVILHEAFHLKLKVEGMPNIGFHLPSDANMANNRLYLKWFVNLFWDKITHHYFYKILDEKLDVDPFNPFKVELDGVIETGEIRGLNPVTQEIGLAGYLLQVWIETNDNEYVNKFKIFLEDKYNSCGINMGGELIEIFKSNPLNDFEDCIDQFIRVFDFIHSGKGIRITGNTRETEQNDKFEENFVLFRVG